MEEPASVGQGTARTAVQAAPPAPAPDAATLNLSLISHTNVGKTTLMRTLLRRDLGEIADRAHVTETAESFVLIDTPAGDVLKLWDTPGFGDSARLLKRLRASDNPIGWLVSQVWDRLTDRPFFSSQQAIRNAKQESDVLLYLVNAAEDPAAAAYVGLEMQILGWIGKPVLLLLNQTGPPRGAEAEAADVTLWRNHVSVHANVRGVISLDAFARCWVQEDGLLRMVGDVVPAAKQQAYARLHEAWRERNREVFEQAMRLLAQQIAAIATDRELVAAAPGFRQKARRWIASLLTERDVTDPDDARAMNALAARFDAAVTESTNRLLALHGIPGAAGAAILARIAGQYDVAKPADPGTSGVIGGVVTGALGGLTADLAAGGLTFGAGALIGGILGALGGTGVAVAYNKTRGAADGSVGWSTGFLAQRPAAALLRYLAIAHFGRGRGEWSEAEYPSHWGAVVEEVVAGRAAEIASLFATPEQVANADALADRLQPIIAAMSADVLIRLYPDSKPLFAPATAAAPT